MKRVMTSLFLGVFLISANAEEAQKEAVQKIEATEAATPEKAEEAQKEVAQKTEATEAATPEKAEEVQKEVAQKTEATEAATPEKAEEVQKEVAQKTEATVSATPEKAERASVVAELKKQKVEPVQVAMRSGNKSRSSSNKLKAVIDLADQKMRIYVGGDHEYTWKVSTGRGGYVTPNGTFKPKWLSRMHYSRKYDDAPMPYSVFFHGGYAIHGTDSISRLGRPASHGCVRLHPTNAKTFFNLVKRHGKSKSTIKIVGTPPIRKVARTYRKRNGTLNHRPKYESRYGSSRRSRSRGSSNSSCLGCGNMASFGSTPSIH